MSVKVIECKDYEEMSRVAAGLVADVMRARHDAVLGLATGSTPVGMYRELARMNRAGEIDFSDVTTVNLDEYYPISPENDQSYRYFMNENLFSHVDVDLSRTFVPDGAATDPDEACRRYEEILAWSVRWIYRFWASGRTGISASMSRRTRCALPRTLPI